MKQTSVALLTLLFGACAALPTFAQRPEGRGADGGNMPHPAPEQIIRDFDQNGDGKLSRDEVPERMRQRWSLIDTDNDNFITLNELKARDVRGGGMKGREKPEERQQASAPAAVIPAAVTGTRAYVNAARTVGNRDGKTWTTAFASLQEALTSNAAEIWVAKGTYTPGSGRDATFQLCTGGALYGGFAGIETRLDQRDWQKNKTLLDGSGAAHVITGADNAVLDGFTVTGGNAVGGGPGGNGHGDPPGGFQGGGGGGPSGGGHPIHTSPDAILGGSATGCGGGLLNFHASPTVRNCVFENNKASKGGAVYNMTCTTFPPRPDADSQEVPLFVNCVFRHNTAQSRGGGVSNDLGTAPMFLNCVFEVNETPEKGGGMYNDFGCSPTLINCLFTGNSAKSAGGMGNDGGSSPVLFHCTFTKNRAVDYGAPLYQGTGPASDPSLIDCLIAGNTCDWGDPGVYNWHDNEPLVKTTAGGDAGYKPGRFTEAQLPRLLAALASYRAQPSREPAEATPVPVPSSRRIVHADATAPAPGDGRSWATAYRNLTTALEDAGRDGAEVRVTAGTYTPGADRSSSFVLRPGVRVYGGYKGEMRDPTKYATVLDGNGAYHVLTGANGAVLDGLTVTGGRADGAGYDGHGGGLVNYRRTPQGRPNAGTATGFTMKINRCVFTGNAARAGGAVYSYDRAKPVFTDCVFTGNRAENGGAILDRVGVESAFERCAFTGNTAMWRGGATFFDYGSRPKLTGCVFRDNSTGGHGGAVFSVSRAAQLENTVVTLAECRFENNTAKGCGGAAAFCDSSVSELQKCTFTGNRAGKEGNDVYTDASSAETSRTSAQQPTKTAEPEPEA